MQLHLEKFNGESAAGMLRWCLSPKEIEEYKDCSRTPKILICIIKTTPEGGYYEETRLIRPITDMAVPVQFRNPGQHFILAATYYRFDDDEYCANALRISHHGNGYESYVMGDFIRRRFKESDKSAENEADGKPCGRYVYSINENRCYIQAKLEVEVSPDLFAPTPKDSKIVNAWFDTKPIDECHHRKRRPLAYFLTFTIGLTIYLFNLLFCSFSTLFLGWHRCNWRWFIHPFTLSIDKSGGYNAYTEYPNGSRKPWWRRLTNWRILVVLGANAYLMFIFWEIVRVWLVFIWPVLFPVLIVLIGGPLLVIFFAWLYDKLLKKSGIAGKLEDEFDSIGATLNRWQEERRKKARIEREKQRELAHQQFEQEMEQLDCRFVPEEISLATLPPEKVTLRLRFYDLKKKMCRPFAGGC